ncbi:MAG: ArsR family transcriptional regulator, partial [archaeon]|nr:ArsR family transcriptional regulator [archaeon]
MSSNKDSKHVERIEIIESNDSNKIIKNNGDIDVEKFIEIFGNDVDRKIIQKLSKVPRFASDLSKDLGISKPAIKKHLDKLIRVGVILHHSKDKNDDKKRYFCLNPNLSLTFRIDLSSNYFNYRAENTAPVTRGVFEKLEKEKAGKHIVQETVLGIKGITGKKKGKHTEISEEEEKEARLEQKRDLLQINTSLIQLGRALRNVEIQIRDIENNRLEIL